MSSMINRLVLAGISQLDNTQSKSNQIVEQHCQQLIIQMNALIKNLAVELLRFNQEDFDGLNQATVNKYNDLIKVQ